MRASLTWFVCAVATVCMAPTAIAEGPVPDRDKATRSLEALKAGMAEQREGRLVEACALLREATELTPTWDLAHLAMASCLRLVGDPFGTAASHLDKAGAVGSDRPGMHVELAKLAEDKGDLERARLEWQRVSELAPADVRPLAASARLSGPGELERLRALTRRQPMNLAAWGKLADAAERARQLDEAEAALRWILARTANRTRAAARLGRFGERHGRAEALQAAREVLHSR